MKVVRVYQGTVMRWATCAGWTADGGPQTAAYDAVNRTVAQNSTNYAYNGDGVLVSDGTTTYAQDLAAPLSQVLSDGTDTYVYGQERLRALGGPWYVGDALGSVRQTLDDAGGVLGSVRYDPWGVPTVGTPQPFGFTGELHAAGQVYLRARWYAPGQGRFVSEDPFVGFPEIPYSLHAYQYAYSNPVRWTDPSGEVIPWCPIGYKRITREDGSFGGCEKTGKVPQWVSDISLTLPGPLLVGPAPGVAGQLGGRTLPQLGTPTASELAQSCLGLTRLLLLSQSSVHVQADAQTQSQNRRSCDRINIPASCVQDFAQYPDTSFQCFRCATNVARKIQTANPTSTVLIVELMNSVGRPFLQNKDSEAVSQTGLHEVVVMDNECYIDALVYKYFGLRAVTWTEYQTVWQYEDMVKRTGNTRLPGSRR
jgi:RHS repeat-associated protein